MRANGRVAIMLCAILIGSMASGCLKNPYTGRRQLNLIPDSTQMRMGLEAYSNVLNDPQVKLSHDPRELQPVKRVADRIVEAAKRSKYGEMAQKSDWRVAVIKDDNTKNAFATPGGRIAVYTGIFPVAQNEAGLAVIMGHEVSHALAQHGAERVSQGVVAQVVVVAASIGAGVATKSRFNQEIALLAGGALATVGFILPYSRQHESEADYVGLMLAADAGYDPQEAVAVWERMERMTGSQPPVFLSTHPSHGTRVTQMNKWMPEALSHYSGADSKADSTLPLPIMDRSRIRF